MKKSRLIQIITEMVMQSVKEDNGERNLEREFMEELHKITGKLGSDALASGVGYDTNKSNQLHLDYAISKSFDLEGLQKLSKILTTVVNTPSGKELGLDQPERVYIRAMEKNKLRVIFDFS